MFTLTTQFDVLLSRLLPPQDRLDAARDYPPLIRSYLQQHETFSTVHPHTRLVGSYGQKMTVGDVKDVDFLVRVPGDPVKDPPDPLQILRDLKDALDDLPAELAGEGLTEIDITGARRSVHVFLKDRDFHLDVVPCIAPDGFGEAIYVPDRGFGTWIKSHPVGVIDLLNALNHENGEKVKPLGKLLKHHRNFQMVYRRPKSYWLLALLVHHVQNGTLDFSQSLGELFYNLVNAIYLQYDHLLHTSKVATPNLADPVLGHNVSWNWGRGDFEAYMRKLDDARTHASKALESDDREKAIKEWQKVFGEEYFPTDVSEEAAQKAKAAWPGQSAVSATGRILTGVGSAGAVKTKETQFFGA